MYWLVNITFQFETNLKCPNQMSQAYMTFSFLNQRLINEFYTVNDRKFNFHLTEWELYETILKNRSHAI